jgi:hypothetical protein
MTITSSTTILGTLGIAVIAVTVLWRLTRPVVELFIQGGYVLFALLTGARFERGLFWMRTGTERWFGLWSQEAGWWPSKVVTAFAPPTVPSVTGLVLARGVDVGWNARTILITILILVGLLALFHADWYTLLLIVAVAGAVAVFVYQASAPAQLGAVIASAWILLLGGLRANLSAAGYPHSAKSQTFPGILARLTDLPAAAWMLLFLLIALAAAIAGARWLLT